MKGLPFKATCEDISKFFTGFNLKAENIYLKRHPDGRPNGEVRLWCGECTGEPYESVFRGLPRAARPGCEFLIAEVPVCRCHMLVLLDSKRYACWAT